MSALPSTTRAIVARTLSTNFRAATSIDVVPLAPPQPQELIVRNRFVGINASDINFTAGVYRPSVQPPFGCGFEALGEVVAVGGKVTDFATRGIVATQTYGAFAEYQRVPARNCRNVPAMDPSYLVVQISGVTAALAVEASGATERQSAVVTAAAGGAGHIAVQLLKAAGCTVLGTCSQPSKVEFLRSLGCDHVVQLRETSLDDAIAAAFPAGIDVAIESVGGGVLDTVLQRLAHHATVVSIGCTSGYADGSAWKGSGGGGGGGASLVAATLLKKSAALRGLFLPHYAKRVPAVSAALTHKVEAGVLRCAVDARRWTGLEDVADAVEHLHSGNNCGKVVVELPWS